MLGLNSSTEQPTADEGPAAGGLPTFQDARSSGSSAAKDRGTGGAEIAEDASRSEDSAGGRIDPQAKIILPADDHYPERVADHRRVADRLFCDQALMRLSAVINFLAAARSIIPWWD